MTRACLICGAERADVAMALVEWREPVDGVTWTSIPRCRDRTGCRTRLEALGDPWPVADGSLATAAKPLPALERAAAVAPRIPWLDDPSPQEEAAP